MKVFASLFLACLVALTVPASTDGQEPPDRGGLEGRITESDGRPVRAVTIVLRSTGDSVVRRGRSSEDGRFRFSSLRAGTYRAAFTRLGYTSETRDLEISVGGPTRLDVVLASEAFRLSGISVEGERSRRRARFEDQVGRAAREISGPDVRSLPGLAEGDPLRAVEILPGVVSTSDLSASFNVRGGSADQNLILLDGFPLFAPFHLGGVFSVFNADMVERIELEAGGFSPAFGGRVSSVLRVETDPGPGELQLDGGLSLLATRAALSGSLPEGVGSALGLESARVRGSLRRSHVDRLLRPVAEIPYGVTDLQGYFEGWTGAGSRIGVTGYTGRDVLDMGGVSDDTFPLRIDWRWGNDVVGARWTRNRPGGRKAEFALGGSRFHTRLRFTDFPDSEFGSEIVQLLARASLVRPLRAGWSLGGGIDLDRYSSRNHAESGGTSLAGGKGSGIGTAPHLRLAWRRSDAWVAEGGLRVETWVPERGETRLVPSPRLSVKRFFARGEGAVRASVGRYAQFAQSVRDEELPLGIDVWVTAGSGVPHLVSDQLQLGVERYLGETWLLAFDAYHRTFDGVVATNPASDPNLPQDDLLEGIGRSYGADLLVERTGGRVTGSLSLSWLEAERSFPDPAAAREDAPMVTYPPIFDRRLDLDLVLRFPLPAGWSGTARWHGGSGLPYTRPRGQYAYFEPRQTQSGRLRWQGGGAESRAEGGERRPWAIAMGDRNAARYPAYHRLDLSVRRTFRPPWGAVTPYLDVLNVYNRSNVLFYFYDFDGDPPTRSGLSMFPVLPTVGVEVRF